MKARLDAMLGALESIVSAESPTDDIELVGKCAHVLSEIGEELLGTRGEIIEVEGRPHLRWQFGEPKVLLLGHFDTVWPGGTIDRWPFKARNDIAIGPGVFDMKAGIIQGLFAVESLQDWGGIEILLTSDEEVGSQTSRALIESDAKKCSAVLVLEPSQKGALKTARKGVSGYTIEIEGRAAHAGLEPERGVNALIELAHQVLELQKIARPEVGTTVVPTVASAPTAKNTVPARASVWVDVRAATSDEQERVDREIRKLEPQLQETIISIKDGPERPPFEESASTELFGIAQDCARRLGLDELKGVAVGGGSDGNLTAVMGVRTLDGLGAVGDGAHAEGEHVLIPAIPERAALLAELIEAVLAGSQVGAAPK